MSSNKVFIRNDRIFFGQGNRVIQEKASLIPDLQQASTLFIGPASMALRNGGGSVSALNPLSSILTVDTGNKRVTVNGVLYGDGSGLSNIPFGSIVGAPGYSSGGDGGTTVYYATYFYLNYSVTASPYKAMELAATTSAPTSILNSLSPASATPISQFRTNFSIPSSIPAGFWSFNLYADTNTATNSMYVSLYSRTGSTETLIATTSSSPTPLQIGFTPTLYSIVMNVPLTDLYGATSLVMKVYASNSDPDWSSMIRTHYEGSTYSHVKTSFGFISQEDAIPSTVTGLGSIGYISSLSLQSTVRGLSSNITSTTKGIYQTLGSSIQTSSLHTTAVTFQDSLLGNANGTLYQKSSILYFNNTAIGGAFTLFSQIYGDP
jgi:hypothetical protein